MPEQWDLGFPGVYRVSPDLGTMTLLANDFVFPNGLAFSPDESVMYITDFRRGLIRAFDVLPNGLLAKQTDRVFADLRGPEPGGPDGLKVDVAGNVYCGGPGGIYVAALGNRDALVAAHRATQFVFRQIHETDLQLFVRLGVGHQMVHAAPSRFHFNIRSLGRTWEPAVPTVFANFHHWDRLATHRNARNTAQRYVEAAY
jgi:hypothetical protein